MAKASDYVIKISYQTPLPKTKHMTEREHFKEYWYVAAILDSYVLGLSLLIMHTMDISIYLCFIVSVVLYIIVCRKTLNIWYIGHQIQEIQEELKTKLPKKKSRF